MVGLPIMHPDSPLNRIFRNRFLIFTGLISYALYMYHQGVNGLVHGFLLGQAPSFASGIDAAAVVLSIGLAYALASISQVVLERPIRRWGYRVTSRLRTSTREPVAA
jgi:peptidoglycan/LPS O-acetylase OafA/YrhL